MKAKRKRSIETDALSPENRKLVDAFKRAREATAPPAGLTIDLEAVARKSISAYWEAKSAGPALGDIDNPVLSPLDQGIKRAVLARINPVRVFVQGILSSLLPAAAAAFAVGVLGYALVQKGASASWTNTLYQYGLPSSFLLAALGLIALFALRRPALLASRWVVLQTSSGPLAGSLIVAAAVAWLAISANNQKLRVNEYKSEVQLESALTELQPIAAQVLSHEQSATQLPQDFDSKLQESKLAKRANIKKVDETNSAEQISYKIYFHIDSEGTPPLDVVVKPDRIEIGRKNEPGYVMLKDSISDVSASSFRLGSQAKFENSDSMPLTGWDQSKTNEIRGSKVMVTYDEVLNKPVGVSLLDRPGMTSIYAAQNLDARIDRLAVSKTARAWQ